MNEVDYVFEPHDYSRLKERVTEAIARDAHLLDELRAEIRTLRSYVRPIHPRSGTSVSLVATDGGNNSVYFDPFLVQIIRVVDSSNNEYCLDAVTPSTDVEALSQKLMLLREEESPLGEMMRLLAVKTLPQLTHMIRGSERGAPVSPSWIQVYRELVEWAVLLRLVRNKDFGSDTLIVWDGLLRSKVFSKGLFVRYRQLVDEAISDQWNRKRRRIYVVGVAKHSSVISRYRLAMALEDVLTVRYPCYAAVPRDIEEKAYKWSEYARGDDRNLENITEANNMVAGKMFLTKFGSGTRDPIWPVDIWLSQVDQAPTILGYLLHDALDGFPVPFFPRCLQKAHENAAMVDFDFEILQDHILSGVRNLVGDRGQIVDILRLQIVDPSKERY